MILHNIEDFDIDNLDIKRFNIYKLDVDHFIIDILDIDHHNIWNHNIDNLDNNELDIFQHIDNLNIVRKLMSSIDTVLAQCTYIYINSLNPPTIKAEMKLV